MTSGSPRQFRGDEHPGVRTCPARATTCQDRPDTFCRSRACDVRMGVPRRRNGRRPLQVERDHQPRLEDIAED